MTAYWWVRALGAILCILPASRGIVHYFQLESYQYPGYFHTLRRNLVHAFVPGILTAALQICVFAILHTIGADRWSGPVQIAAVVLYFVLNLGIGLLVAKLFTVRKAKKKFVYTGRIKRFFVVYALVLTLLSFWMRSIQIQYTFLLAVFIPLLVAVSGLLAWPVEKAISETYFRDARRKLLRDPSLIRIGITGSYGKTSVKTILGTLLGEKYSTLITPASFNTPMGVTRTIREKLLPTHRVFVGEMGARHVGDIKEMCRLVKPTIGILTSVGPQHLETFHTIDRVASTKYELIEALPADGHAYFFDDGDICTRLYEKTTKPKTLCSLRNPNADCYADDIRVSAAGVSFALHIKGHDSVACSTKLLGEHSLQNILLAAALASDLGISPKQIAHAISGLQPIANRLQLMNTAAGFTIINDAFNSNPIGAASAMRVLKQFPERRIVITPGMVELGADEEKFNYKFGRQIAESADIAIIIGKNRAEPILKGLRDAGFAEDKMHRVSSLNESTQLLYSLVQKGDTVLYENDLPDHYQEA